MALFCLVFDVRTMYFSFIEKYFNLLKRTSRNGKTYFKDVVAFVPFWERYALKSQPFERQTHKIVRHTQTIRPLLADELFECV